MERLIKVANTLKVFLPKCSKKLTKSLIIINGGVTVPIADFGWNIGPRVPELNQFIKQEGDIYYR